MPSTTTDLKQELYSLFVKKFNDEELAHLAFMLGVNVKDLGEETLKGKARELADYIVRREWEARLAEIGPREFPDVDWTVVQKGGVTQGLLSDDDRRKLVEIIANTYSMQMGPSSRLSILQNAGLHNRAMYIDLAQSPIHLASAIVADLEPLGMLPGQPTYHALGALINYLRLEPDMPQQEADILAKLLVKYQLIADPAYLDTLKASFGSEVTPVRQIDPTLLSPSPTLGTADEVTTRPTTADQEEPKGPSSPQPLTVDKETPQVSPKQSMRVPSPDVLLDIELLAGAIYTAQAVCRIEMPEGTPLCTGFLIGPDLLLTVSYALKSKEKLSDAVARFDYRVDASGVAGRGRVIRFDPDFYIASPPEELSFALMRLKDEPLAEWKMQPGDEGLSYLELLRRGRHRGYLLLAPRQIVKGERVNIVQHAEGGPQRVALTDNYAPVDMTDIRAYYLASTWPGSGGAPVCNNRWEVIALHHAGSPYPALKESDPLRQELKSLGVKVNQGIPIRAILPKIERYLEFSYFE